MDNIFIIPSTRSCSMLCPANSTSASAEGGACPVLRPLCFQSPPGLKQKDRALRDRRGMLARSDAEPPSAARDPATYPILSTRSHNTLGVGTSGEPSYRTKDAPVARADTIQFHIIQPTCHKQGNRVSKAEVQAPNPSTRGQQGEAAEEL